MKKLHLLAAAALLLIAGSQAQAQFNLKSLAEKAKKEAEKALKNVGDQAKSTVSGTTGNLRDNPQVAGADIRPCKC